MRDSNSRDPPANHPPETSDVRWKPSDGVFHGPTVDRLTEHAPGARFDHRDETTTILEHDR
ncbi:MULTISPECIES: hypothetical protein [unclassified Haladaptatus]|uniref:hypothetical protein n=1 Tax=unclassified Haladaptatus TaxID=2622732 RepID=UPI00209C2C02|nr:MULTISPECIES: hypothetical protein [unclassified Haladaptatus]MCO8244793.1 hypothetical protein [Haladaptatus sp. AB643]MCO8255695.1 hypothetical protein [Haladaptatus sp. AB618]